MYQSDVTKKYQENSCYSMNQEELTLALYNGLVKFLMKAELGLTEKNLEMVNENLQKAENILLEFVVTLNMEYEVANGLALLYDYMIRQVRDANVSKDIEIIRELIHFAKELRDTWSDAMKIAKKSHSMKVVSIAK